MLPSQVGTEQMAEDRQAEEGGEGTIILVEEGATRLPKRCKPLFPLQNNQFELYDREERCGDEVERADYK